MPSHVFAQALLDGQVAVVTGGGSGLGRAAAIELAACGARVVAAGEAQEALDQTAALCEGSLCEGIACDVGDEDQVEALFDRAVERHGRVDTLVNTVEAPGEPAADVRRAWLPTHAAATRSMIPSGGGRVLSAAPPSPAARAGIENLTRVLSIEWSRYAIHLNALVGAHEAAADQAWLIAYLASQAGDYCTGAVFTMDAAPS